MSAVVLHELLVGAGDERRRRLLEARYAGEFRRRGRLFAPSQRVWSRAAQVDRKLRQDREYRSKLEQRSFANDLLIALTCREIGAIVVTANMGDFELIRRVTGVRYEPDLPEPAPGTT